MNENRYGKRIAFVVNALTGNELKAGKSDSARVFQVLVDSSLGACDPGSARLFQDCPDRDTFNKYLLKVLEKWTPGDQLLLYYSGHGEESRGLYHLCFGVEGKSRFPFKNILTELESAGVNRAILILDSCQSGAALRKGQKSSSLVPVINEDEIPNGLAIISSCRANENSHEKDDQTQSVFTALFYDAIASGLGGLPTPDGKISVADLVGWVNKKLEADSELARFCQTSTYGIDRAEHPVWIAKNKSGRIVPRAVEGQLNDEEDRGNDLPQSGFNNWLTNARTFSAETVKSYRDKLRPDVRESQLPDSLDDASFLAKANLLLAGRLYAAGLLLFAEQPESLVPTAYVQCFEFIGINRSAPQHQKEFYGPLMRQLEGAMTFIESRIEKVEVIEQGVLAARFEYQYPMVCIREILANAFCHRDYLDGSGHIQVRVFQDRIEIVSPGPWASKVIEDDKETKLEELESEPTTRNERLATALRRIKLVETGGSGIPSALSDCEELGARPPTVLSRQGKIKVTIYPRNNWSEQKFYRRGNFFNISPTSTIELQHIRINDVSGPLVIFFGPRAIGKTLTIIRLCNYLQKYQIYANENFRTDNDTYKNTIDGFEAIRRDSLFAPNATGSVNFLLLNVTLEDSIVCQFLEAPGEHFFERTSPNMEYPTYLNQIFDGEYRKVFLFFFEPEMFHSDQQDWENYTSRISRLIEEKIRPKRDNVVIVFSKCDLLHYFRGGEPIVSEYRKALYSNPSFSALRDVLTRCGLKRVPFVPFSAGSFNDDGAGKIVFSPSSEHYPKRLWDEIHECVVGRPWWRFW